jgi:CubicO group peptidase (beta-lactamase class C family)
MAVNDGLLSIEQTVLPFFPEYITPEIERNMGALRIRHLLTMSAGHAQDPTGAVRTATDGNWVKAFLETPIEHSPGSKFVYSSGATYMLSAILQKTTGQSLLDYLQTRLFEPLGIEHATWDRCPLGINTGGWGLSLKTEDIAKFGQLYLRQGVWNGQRLLSEEWIEEATSCHISTESMKGIDKQMGYGFQFWRCRYGAYCGRGANGQFCIVMPEQDAVIAITANDVRMQHILDLIWEHLLPALG